MEQSLFIQYVQKWFGPKLIQGIIDTINGTKKPLTYSFKEWFKPSFSPTLKWGSLSTNGSIVAADVVSMDSSLPLKRRDSIKKAEGDIPKLGMKLYLNERTMTDLQILQSTNQNGSRENAIIKLLFADTKKCISGVYERLEHMAHQAISTGITLIEDEKNTGVGIRVDFGHPDKNKFGVIKPWSDEASTPIQDIENVLEKAREKGDTLSYILMDRKSWNNFRKRADVKDLFAADLGFTGTNIPTPNLEQVNKFLNASYNLVIQVIDRSITFEKNGKRTVSRPWADNAVVFSPTLDFGDLAYGYLAEETFKAEGVTYAKAEDYILLSKYHKNDPLREFTSSQALVIPVINNIDSIYIMNSEEATTDAQTEADANFDYEGVSYTKASVVAAINLADPEVTAKTTHTDVYLQMLINQLSDAQIETFEANITEAT